MGGGAGGGRAQRGVRSVRRVFAQRAPRCFDTCGGTRDPGTTVLGARRGQGATQTDGAGLNAGEWRGVERGRVARG